MFPPSDKTFGRDANNIPALGGFTATGETLSAEMEPGSVDGIGAVRVHIAGGSLPPSGGSGVEYGSLAVDDSGPAAVPATLPCKSLFVLNDDGAGSSSGNGVVFWGFDSSVSPATGIPLRPGGAISLDISDATGVFFVCDTGETADLRWATMG